MSLRINLTVVAIMAAMNLQLFADTQESNRRAKEAFALFETGQEEQAVELLESLLAEDPESCVANSTLAIVLAEARQEKLQDPERAMRHARRGDNLCGCSWDKKAFAAACWATGEQEEAIRYLRLAIDGANGDERAKLIKKLENYEIARRPISRETPRMPSYEEIVRVGQQIRLNSGIQVTIKHLHHVDYNKQRQVVFDAVVYDAKKSKSAVLLYDKGQFIWCSRLPHALAASRFTSIQQIAISDDGKVFFQAELSNAATRKTTDAICCFDGKGLAVLMQGGARAPSFFSEVVVRDILSFKMSPDGHIAVYATVAGDGISKSNNHCLWLGTREHLEMAVRTGVGTPSLRIQKLFGIKGYEIANGGTLVFWGWADYVDEQTLEDERGDGLWIGRRNDMREIASRPIPELKNPVISRGVGAYVDDKHAFVLSQTGRIALPLCVRGDNVFVPADGGIEIVSREQASYFESDDLDLRIVASGAGKLETLEIRPFMPAPEEAPGAFLVDTDVRGIDDGGRLLLRSSVWVPGDLRKWFTLAGRKNDWNLLARAGAAVPCAKGIASWPKDGYVVMTPGGNVVQCGRSGSKHWGSYYYIAMANDGYRWRPLIETERSQVGKFKVSTVGSFAKPRDDTIFAATAKVYNDDGYSECLLLLDISDGTSSTSPESAPLSCPTGDGNDDEAGQSTTRLAAVDESRQVSRTAMERESSEGQSTASSKGESDHRYEPRADGPAGMKLPGAARVWKDVTGRYQVKATYLGLANDTVRLRTSDGRRIAVPLTRMSMEDRKHIRQIDAVVGRDKK